MATYWTLGRNTWLQDKKEQRQRLQSVLRKTEIQNREEVKIFQFTQNGHWVKTIFLKQNFVI